jgi:hypothetical protein
MDALREADLDDLVADGELKELCQAEGAQSIRTLVAIRDSPRAGGMARLKAIESSGAWLWQGGADRYQPDNPLADLSGAAGRW